MLLRRGSITVCLTSCLTGLDSTILVNNYVIQHKQSSWIVTSQTGGQPYSDTSTYKLSECSLPKLPMHDKRIGFSSQVFLKHIPLKYLFEILKLRISLTTGSPHWTSTMTLTSSATSDVLLPSRFRRYFRFSSRRDFRFRCPRSFSWDQNCKTLFTIKPWAKN